MHIQYFISVYASVLSVPTVRATGDANAEDSAGGKL